MYFLVKVTVDDIILLFCFYCVTVLFYFINGLVDAWKTRQTISGSNLLCAILEFQMRQEEELLWELYGHF